MVRTLAVVQGHPKLIEMADGLAAEPAGLQERLVEADQAWIMTGTRLEAFFEQGKSTATEQGYLRVLNDWTRATVEMLPDASAVLFQFLCALEEADRLGAVVESNWADLWRRLDRTDDPPDLGSALAPLEAHGLIAVETGQDQPVVYRLHPGIAEAGRATAGSDFQNAVDTQLAAYWRSHFRPDSSRRPSSWAGLCCAPGGAQHRTCCASKIGRLQVACSKAFFTETSRRAQ